MADSHPEAAKADPVEATIQAAEKPDAVRALISAERRSAREAKDEAKAARDAAKAEADGLRLTIERMKAAAGAGLDLSLAERLSGSTPDELAADAIALAARLPSTEPSRPTSEASDVNPYTGRRFDGAVPFLDPAETVDTSGRNFVAQLLGTPTRVEPEEDPAPATAADFDAGARTPPPLVGDPVREHARLIAALAGRNIDRYAL